MPDPLVNMEGKKPYKGVATTNQHDILRQSSQKRVGFCRLEESYTFAFR